MFAKLFNDIQTAEVARIYRCAASGILLIPFTQLLVVPLQSLLDAHNINLPASVLIMFLVLICLLLVDFMAGGIDTLYRDYMRGPTDFLGRHMSFGFVVPFIMLNRDHITDPKDVGRIAGAFLITSLANYLGVFFFTSASLSLERRLRGKVTRATDLEGRIMCDEKATDLSSPSACCSRRASKLSQATTLLSGSASTISMELPVPRHKSKPLSLKVRMLPTFTALLLLIIIGIPVSCAVGYDMPLEVFGFVCFWTATIFFQRHLKTRESLNTWPRCKYALVVTANPVLLTSALGTTYFWLKTIWTRAPIERLLTAFRCHNSWAAIFRSLRTGGAVTEHIGAGDLATALLDAGIVSLGLKMFEYRRELWASLLSIFTTCTIFAIINVFVNPLLAHAVGLSAQDALAFSARSTTIALGVPAVESLGGSTTMSSALVVFSGMLFQVFGDFVFHQLNVRDRHSQDPNGHQGHDEKTAFAAEKENEVTELRGSFGGDGNHDQQKSDKLSGKVVAAGVTVGINAAAMGTAHLIERDSKAVAYSALAMTIFGVMTVGMTAIPPVPVLLGSLISR